MKGAQVQAVYGVVDEVRKVPLGQPVLQCAGQQLLLFGVVRNVAGVHPPLTINLTFALLVRTLVSAAQTPRHQ